MSKSKFVTCIDNGLQTAREDAYYVPSKRRYFSSKEAYERWSKPDPYWNKVIGELIDDTNYPSNLKLPGVILKRLQDNYKGIGFEAVYVALTEKKRDIKYRMEINNFENYTKRFNYILAMIRDDVPVVAQKLKDEKRNEVKDKNVGLDFEGVDNLTLKDNHTGRKDLTYLIE